MRPEGAGGDGNRRLSAVKWSRCSSDSRRCGAPQEMSLGEAVESFEAQPSVTAIRNWWLGAAASRWQWCGGAELGFGHREENRARLREKRAGRGERSVVRSLSSPRSISGSRGGRAGTEEEEVGHGLAPLQKRRRRPRWFCRKPLKGFVSNATRSFSFIFLFFFYFFSVIDLIGQANELQNL